MNSFFNKSSSLLLIEKITQLNHQYDHSRHRLIIKDSNNDELFSFRLPIHIYSPEHPDRQVNYIILIIQSGSSAVGYFEDEENIDHKVFSAYMVRKKQGKSQIKYLKTKGKSRAGSRVRLAGTTVFFENINGRLQEYFDVHAIDRIGFSCSKILLPYLFNSKVRCPFDKSDHRLYKIPKHIHTPNYGEMMNVHRYLLHGELICEEKYADIAKEMLII